MKFFDLAQKVITGGLIGFTVLGTVNLVSMYSYKMKRNERADSMLEEITKINEET